MHILSGTHNVYIKCTVVVVLCATYTPLPLQGLTKCYSSYNYYANVCTQVVITH